MTVVIVGISNCSVYVVCMIIGTSIRITSMIASVNTSNTIITMIMISSIVCLQLSAPLRLPAKIRGDHLSSTTCLTQMFFNSGE